MAADTKIEWTDATWNPVRGCTRTSSGCQACYAERITARFSKPGQPYEGLAEMTAAGSRWTGKLRLIEERLDDPIRWRKPRRIFVNSMSDLFHEQLEVDDIARVWAVMLLVPHHTFQILTKRAERMRAILTDPAFYDLVMRFATAKRRTLPRNLQVFGISNPTARPTPWIWLGVSIEDQRTADGRIPHLLRTPAAVRVASCEPLLGPIDLFACGGLNTVTRAMMFEHETDRASADWLDWVIAGGESGLGARPMHPDWARSLRDQCQAAWTPFFFKQHGAYCPIDASPDEPVCCHCGCTESRACPGGCRWIAGDDTFDRCSNCRGKPSRLFRFDDGTPMLRVGKHAAGRLLDGREWNEFPATSR